jgi:hypothetical protein
VRVKRYLLGLLVTAMVATQHDATTTPASAQAPPNCAVSVTNYPLDYGETMQNLVCLYWSAGVAYTPKSSWKVIQHNTSYWIFTNVIGYDACDGGPWVQRTNWGSHTNYNQYYSGTAQATGNQGTCGVYHDYMNYSDHLRSKYYSPYSEVGTYAYTYWYGS